MTKWLQQRVEGQVLREQTMPQWTRRTGGQDQHAVLDVVWQEAGTQRCLDVVITAPDDGSEQVERMRANRAGAAAKKAEDSKHRRYPAAPGTPHLIAFAVENMGRAGEEARAWVKEHVVRSDDDPTGSVDATRFWQGLSAVVQSCCAEQILAATTLPENRNVIAPVTARPGQRGPNVAT